MSVDEGNINPFIKVDRIIDSSMCIDWVRGVYVKQMI